MCDLTGRLHVDPPHGRQVDHEAIVQDAVSRRVVTSPANGDLQVVRTREGERGGDVVAPTTANDQRRPAIDECVETATRAVVLRLGGR
jgi:hypothetical protein